MLADLSSRFDAVLEAVEATDGWVITLTAATVAILAGCIGGVN